MTCLPYITTSHVAFSFFFTENKICNVCRKNLCQERKYFTVLSKEQVGPVKPLGQDLCQINVMSLTVSITSMD